MTTDYDTKELETVFNNLCDTAKEADLAQQLKGKGALVVSTLVCDAGGNLLFSWDTVVKYG